MKKKLLPVLLIALQLSNCFSQSTWTYVHGDSTSNSPGNFGTLGVASPANNPPSIYEPAEWTDHDGNFWMFGGGYTYSCLWKFDVSLGEWIWMGGSSSTGQSGSYGTQGVSSPANHPGARVAATTWVDNDGHLWLYAGYGYDAFGGYGGLSDLWKFDVSSNEWTWIDGAKSMNLQGVYGTKGVPAPANDPGSRLESAAAWADDSNQLWFFGGQLCCSAFGYIDDVWRYNISSGEWTWMQGSNVSMASPVYGTLGVPDPANTPGGRRIYSHWKDADGNFWLFGGQDNFQGCFNDLWKYDHAQNVWTWMHGSSVINGAGHYGTECLFDALNDPPSRMENRFYWTDSCSNFWMFGGLNTFNGQYRNDMWCYNPTVNEWKWAGGLSAPDQNGLYGIKGAASTSTYPGARYGGVAWMGPAESLWLFGGVGYPWDNNVGNLNDLWKFIPDTSCVNCKILSLPHSAFQSSDTTICQKFCIDFFDQSSNSPVSWQWIFDGGTPASSTDQNPAQICYNNPGVYDVTLITTNSYGSDTLILNSYITVYSTPPFPTITVNGNVLTSSNASGYQWQFNSVDIPGATNQSYTATQTGFYTVIITDENGCVSAATVYVDVTGIENLANGPGFSVYPNPSNGNFTIVFSTGTSGTVSIELVNTLGQKIFSSKEDFYSHDKKEIHLNEIERGIYFLEFISEDLYLRKKITVIK